MMRLRYRWVGEGEGWCGHVGTYPLVAGTKGFWLLVVVQEYRGFEGLLSGGGREDGRDEVGMK